jgi:hypothetical protein
MCTMSGHESQVLGILSLHKMQSKEATLPVSCRGRASLCIGAVSLNSHFEPGPVAEEFVQVSTPFRRAIIGKE